MKVSVEQVEVHSDHRGAVLRPVSPEDLAWLKDVHAGITLPGCVRGNHYHPKATEVLVLFGPCLVRLREEGGLRDVIVREGEVCRFNIPPGVSHAFKNIGAQSISMVAFSSCADSDGQTETIKDILID